MDIENEIKENLEFLKNIINHQVKIETVSYSDLQIMNEIVKLLQIKLINYKNIPDFSEEYFDIDELSIKISVNSQEWITREVSDE